MKIQNLFSLVLIVFSSSCAMISGNKNDTISISSQPAGANIIIEGVNYGKTPATITIEAKNSKVSLIKEGYGFAELEIEAWSTMKNGGCSIDAITSILPWSIYSSQWSGYCNEFKQKQYFVIIPTSRVNNMNNDSSSSSPNSSKQMMNYYQNQEGQFPNNNLYNRKR